MSLPGHMGKVEYNACFQGFEKWLILLEGGMTGIMLSLSSQICKNEIGQITRNNGLPGIGNKAVK